MFWHQLNVPGCKPTLVTVPGPGRKNEGINAKSKQAVWLIIATEDTLSFFTVFVCHHISPKSVDSYLSGICDQLEPQFPNIRAINKNVLVLRTLQGCKRLRGTAVHRKLPLSRDHLRRAITALPSCPSHDDLLFLSSLLSGFRTLLRLGQLTMPDNHKLRNPRKYPRPTRIAPGLQTTTPLSPNRWPQRGLVACNTTLGFAARASPPLGLHLLLVVVVAGQNTRCWTPNLTVPGRRLAGA
ncbi:hypothetical protein B0H11DRAFT_2221461 [Mycena galericulata]|nr:hypothetical protein B0H11DRAFT_2221461 [Mycena galericulata]